MANRIVLQVDQTAPQDQVLLGLQPQRRKDTNLDRRGRLCHRRYCQKETRSASIHVRNSTDSEYQYFRQNAHKHAFSATLFTNFQRT
jgi:hypothetical protein